LGRSFQLSRSSHQALREVTIVPDLTQRQRKEEQEKVMETKRKNLTRSEAEVSKNLFYKVVGKKGARREILAPLLPGEYLDREGLVVREGRKGMAVTRGTPLTGSNQEPVGRAKLINSQEQNHMQVQDKTEDGGLNLSVERASPGDHLGSQVSTNGRRPSVSQEQWTPTKKRKSRGSKESQGSPDNQVKKGREEGEWVWQGCSQ
jgi:hypothetical protein